MTKLTAHLLSTLKLVDDYNAKYWGGLLSYCRHLLGGLLVSLGEGKQRESDDQSRSR